jgi:hypothetical protein
MNPYVPWVYHSIGNSATKHCVNAVKRGLTSVIIGPKVKKNGEQFQQQYFVELTDLKNTHF